MKKRIGQLFIYGTIFLRRYVNNIAALLLYKAYFFEFFNMVDYFQIFF